MLIVQMGLAEDKEVYINSFHTYLKNLNIQFLLVKLLLF